MPRRLRVVIVDDEVEARDRLRGMLREIEDVELVGEAADGLQALNLTLELLPDVLLLDVVMPELTGMDVEERLRKIERRPLVIFQTGYDRYAIEAFERQAVDYLLKPVSPDRLRKALTHARERLGAANGSPARAEPNYEELARVREKIAPRQSRGLLLRERTGRYTVLPWNEVTHVVVEDHYVYARRGKVQKLVDMSLDQIEVYSGGAFIPASRSALVNLDAVTGYESNGDGSAEVTLKDGERVHVSRRRAADVLDSLRGGAA